MAGSSKHWRAPPSSARLGPLHQRGLLQHWRAHPLTSPGGFTRECLRHIKVLAGTTVQQQRGMWKRWCAPSASPEGRRHGNGPKHSDEAGLVLQWALPLKLRVGPVVAPSCWCRNSRGTALTHCGYPRANPQTTRETQTSATANGCGLALVQRQCSGENGTAPSKWHSSRSTTSLPNKHRSSSNKMPHPNPIPAQKLLLQASPQPLSQWLLWRLGAWALPGMSASTNDMSGNSRTPKLGVNVVKG